MRTIQTRLPGVCVLEPKVHGDARGHFFEAYNRSTLAAEGVAMQVEQVNVSRSARGVLRGLHYQWPTPQAKLVWVLEGEVYDVAVDIRRGSPTFGYWEAAVLSADNHRQFFIPRGFAHGFQVTSDFATFCYLVDAPYDRAADAAIRWDDPALAIDWPIRTASVSDKDARAPRLAEVAVERLPMDVPGEGR